MNGTELFRRTMVADYGCEEMSSLMARVWTPTPWMIDVLTDGREQEIWNFCYRNFGPECSPIHKKEGDWHRASVTMHGRTWIGFKTEAMMKQFEKQFPSPSNA